MLAEGILARFVVDLAARSGRQIWDWRTEAMDRTAWTDVPCTFAAHAAGLYSHTFRAVRGDTDGAQAPCTSDGHHSNARGGCTLV